MSFLLDIKKELAEVVGGALPAGTYDFVCYAAELKRWQDGDDISAILRLQVTSGTQAGKKQDFMLVQRKDRSPVAANIGRKHLAQIALACGFDDKLPRVEDLVGKEFRMTFKWNGQYPNITAVMRREAPKSVARAHPLPTAGRFVEVDDGGSDSGEGW